MCSTSADKSASLALSSHQGHIKGAMGLAVMCIYEHVKATAHFPWKPIEGFGSVPLCRHFSINASPPFHAQISQNLNHPAVPFGMDAPGMGGGDGVDVGVPK
jgi:hypothetical protein